MFSYKVMEQYPMGEELPCASFKNLADAKFFMQHKFETNLVMKVNVKFILYRNMDVLETLSTQDESASSGRASSQTQKPQASMSFQPTPLNMRPRPPGTPPNWLVENDDEIEK